MEQFTIFKDYWFAWQMVPGYVGERCVPYCSPIHVREVTPRKTGKSVLGLRFWNSFYAQGVQDFALDLRVLKRGLNYVVGEIMDGPSGPSGRCAIVSHIEFGWIEHFCPGLWFRRPPTSCSSLAGGSVQIYLDEVVFGRLPKP